jgi:predicted peptidase
VKIFDRFVANFQLPSLLRAISNSHGYDYLLSQPPGSEQDTSRRWPLLLFLHGVGERGSQLNDITRQGLPKLLSGDPGLSSAETKIARDVATRFIVVSPQCPHYEVWSDDAVLQLIDRVSADNPVDSSRVYFTGLSMGGFGVWSIGLRHFQRFAALVPICGGGRVSDVAAAAKKDPVALRQLGVWAFHGANDRVVPLEESARMIEALRLAGVPDVKFTAYPDCEHDSWSATYLNPELFTWLLQHAR